MTDYTRALCVGADPDLFAPDVFDAATIRQAIRICDMCPVTAPCQAEARTEKLTGVYGGRYMVNGRPRERPAGRGGQHRTPLPPIGVRQCLGCGTRELTGKSRYCHHCAAASKRAAWRRYKTSVRG